MEEIVTVDGRQFKLTTDRPLTSLEKSQAIADIRKQAGCSGGCGQRSMDPNWGYGGGIGYLASPGTPTCPAGPKGTLTPITFNIAPTVGTAPYTARYYIKRNTEAPFLMVTGTGTPVLGTVTGPNPNSGIPESPNGIATTGAGLTYTLTDSDIAAAMGDAAERLYATNAAGAVIETTAVSPATGNPLIAGRIRFFVTTTDSCPTGAQSCIEWCDVVTVCPAPTCNFVVT